MESRLAGKEKGQLQLFMYRQILIITFLYIHTHIYTHAFYFLNQEPKPEIRTVALYP